MDEKFVYVGHCKEATQDFEAGFFNKRPRGSGKLEQDTGKLCTPSINFWWLPNFFFTPGRKYRVTIERIEE